ncbi:hypothetical protein MON38_04385 [Hymenobacter sp. DH14]|uniref:Tetratricopeptide repeat protein n=1 Tax=Hymenobacter cyanobacteriorum TaxID=2926463 RepID=A0A9X1VCI6_9BACT|nr:hypothetical protein [Hymenobacter cyanobacteriorum]MCI1186644.1 hypothetical protein [Hymenobacter cyanobacteriorum]
MMAAHASRSANFEARAAAPSGLSKWRGDADDRVRATFLLLLVLLLAAAPAGRAQAPAVRPDSTLRSASELMAPLPDSMVVVAPEKPLPRLAPAPPTLADFRYADSVFAALAARGRWAALDSAVRAAQQLGSDYPALHRYRGQAALHRERPAAALREYGTALHTNPLDTLARYGLTLAYLQLNQPGPAALLARALPDSLRRPLHLAGFRLLTGVEVEGGAQFPNTFHRGPSAFGRLGFSSRLSPRVSLTQNLTHFSQSLDQPDIERRGFDRRYRIRQNQYHALLAVQLSPRWRALAGYHVLSSDLGRRESPIGQMGYAALAYTRPYYTVQAGFYAGTLTDTARTQTDLRLTVYPLGNLRLYGFGRASVVRSAGRSYPNGVFGAGGRLHRRVWAEAYGGLGLVPVLAEVDGTYVYNLLDPVRERAGASLLFLLPKQLSLRLAGSTERRRDAFNGTYYSLQSLSTTLAWTW